MPDAPALHPLDGPGGLPLLSIQNRHASARLLLQGAHLLSYQPAGAPEVLFVSPNAVYAPGQAVRGGVPVCWPWFGPDPEGRGRPAHGFARNRVWALRSAATTTDDGATELRLGLSDDADTRALWPHAFDLELSVTVGPVLRLALTTRNTGDTPFTITQALHSYFAVGDIGAVQVQGLGGCGCIDKLAGGARVPGAPGPVVFDGPVDRIYQRVPPTLQVVDAAAGRRLALHSEGSTTAVVWNPGAALAATMADLGGGAQRGFVCVETANAGDEVVTLAPGASHRLAVSIDPRAG